jgi:hypothetical protein
MRLSDEYGLSALASTLYDDIISGGKCAIWVGAGLSEGVYPSYSMTIDELVKECMRDNRSQTKSTTEALIGAAEQCKLSDPLNYERTLARIFSEDKPVGRPEYHFLVATDYICFVTTNFDPLFEEACQVHSKPVPLHYYPVLPIGQISARECFYIHGAAKQNGAVSGKNLIFAESEFNEAYNKDRGRTYKFVTELIAFYDILFVGCEIDDPYVKRCFDEMKKIHNDFEENQISFKPPRCKILLRDRIVEGMSEEKRIKEEQRKKSEREKFESLGIEIIRFPTIKGQDSHYALKQILKMIQHFSTSRPTGAPTWSEESADDQAIL